MFEELPYWARRLMLKRYAPVRRQGCVPINALVRKTPNGGQGL